MKIFSKLITHEHNGELYGEAKLDLDTRSKSRSQVQLTSSEDIGIVLPRGILLRGGDLLADADEKHVIRIAAKDEQVSTAYCPDPLQLAKVCYHLGNRHVPLQIATDFARYQHDHVLDDMLKQMGVEVKVEYAAFEPEAGAYSHGHSHDSGSHSHGDHHHGSDDAHEHKHSHSHGDK